MSKLVSQSGSLFGKLNFDKTRLFCVVEDVIAVCGSLDELFQSVTLPKVDPNWSVLETVQAFEKSLDDSETHKGQTSCNRMKLIKVVTGKMKEWIGNN